MNSTQLAEIIANTWTQLYQDRYFSDPTVKAQDQLSGRTHYVDPDTLRYHHARVLRAMPVCSGLLFRIVESVAADPDNNRRVFRFVVFDVWGNVIEKADFANAFSSIDKALKAFDQWLNGFDLIEYYRFEMATRVKRTQDEANRLQTALDQMILANMEEATA